MNVKISSKFCNPLSDSNWRHRQEEEMKQKRAFHRKYFPKKPLEELFTPQFKHKLLYGSLKMNHWRAFKRRLRYFDYSNPEVCSFIQTVEQRFLAQLPQQQIDKILELRNARKRMNGE